MNVFDAGHIRNVVLVGHQGSGKTSLAEAMLFGPLAKGGRVRVDRGEAKLELDFSSAADD